ncbi:head-tail connector protein [Acidovorax sp. NCPPB 3576]|uniref:head-tail connector protein n=1 Tax=Acidovorax sp. NCPPB 3576 TaxID=2940488 RepID=UPI0023493E3B|nr:head-tail connector protein [Acidovorax sp. NCPPB 3576]WCM86653.1 head-tail connector protein [Acidovorax sp. NCPPB 3576]
MTPFATLEQVKQHLRVDDDSADDDLILKLEAASERIAMHLNGVPPFQPELDSLGQPVRDTDGKIVYTTAIRSIVKSATLLLVGYLYRYPSGDEKKAFEDGQLPAPITALLAPIRKRVLA